MKKEKMVIGVMIFLSIILVVGIIKLNLPEKQSIVAENLEDDMDIKEEKEDFVIPPIKAPTTKTEDANNKENPDSIDILEYKETIEEIDGDKVLVKPTPPPKEEKLPEAMETPKAEPKPTTPPKPIDTTTGKKDDKTDILKDKEKPPTTKKVEPSSDGVVRDLKGNPTGLTPATNVQEVKGSDLLDEGEVAGEGDKF